MRDANAFRVSDCFVGEVGAKKKWDAENATNYLNGIFNDWLFRDLFVCEFLLFISLFQVESTN